MICRSQRAHLSRENALGSLEIGNGSPCLTGYIADVDVPAEITGNCKPNNLDFGTLRDCFAIEMEGGMRTGSGRGKIVTFLVKTVLVKPPYVL